MESNCIEMTLLKPAVRIKSQYQNPIPTKLASLGAMLPVLREMLTSKAQRIPAHPVGPFFTDLSTYRTQPTSGLRVTLIGHSSVLLEIDGSTVLFDPVFCDRASMVQWAGPKRFYAPPLRLEDLPPLDAVILSHDHYDHLDRHTVPLLQERTKIFLCSLGVESHLQRWGIDRSKIRPMNWMDSVTLPSGLQVTALPARHFTGRSLKRMETLWSSFAVKGPQHNVYFGADTGPWPGFPQIGEQFGPFDLAMLEVGAWHERWGMIHLGPDSASEAFRALNARVFMPIHWGLFNLALHDWFQPAERSLQLSVRHGYPIFLPEPGKPTEYDPAGHNPLWWRKFL